MENDKVEEKQENISEAIETFIPKLEVIDEETDELIKYLLPELKLSTPIEIDDNKDVSKDLDEEKVDPISVSDIIYELESDFYSDSDSESCSIKNLTTLETIKEKTEPVFVFNKTQESFEVKNKKEESNVQPKRRFWDFFTHFLFPKQIKAIR